MRLGGTVPSCISMTVEKAKLHTSIYFSILSDIILILKILATFLLACGTNGTRNVTAL